ncbi:heparanase-like protein 1 [Euphorbia lathyris]|uniref:heparanase-like protein 1 n=1 Tax=Euphorbia lathyris TaxID=212925 RepID=UPI003313F125
MANQLRLRESFVLMVLLMFSYCAYKTNAEDAIVTVRGLTSISNTDDTFICATLDWWPSTKCDYGQCPWGLSGILNLDLQNKILANAIKAFNPLRLRVGGSLQDQVLYKVGNNSIKKFPHFKRRDKNGFMFGFTRGTLTMDRWDQLNTFFNQTGAKITFSLNALYGKRKSKDDSILWVGRWNPNNARDLMRYTISKGYNIDSYELGNELCGTGVSAKIEAVDYAKDMMELKKLVLDLYGNSNSTPGVLGPAGFYNKRWFDEFLEATGPNVLTGVTHHIYNLGAGRDKNLIKKIQDPYILDQVAQTFKDVSDSVNKFAAWTSPWVGESGGAYNSGGKDVSHTFANGFWYLDQLGMTAAFNHKVYCRQTLIGGNYGLLNTTTFLPNPDYYSALLWHRLMGKEVLATTHSTSPYLRAYSHCSKNKPGIAILLINMSNQTSFTVTVKEDDNPNTGSYSFGYSNAGTKPREEYHLTPLGGNIQSDVMLLNGRILKLTESLEIPTMNPQLVDPWSPISVAPYSVVYAVIPDFKAPACGLDNI